MLLILSSFSTLPHRELLHLPLECRLGYGSDEAAGEILELSHHDRDLLKARCELVFRSPTTMVS